MHPINSNTKFILSWNVYTYSEEKVKANRQGWIFGGATEKSLLYDIVNRPIQPKISASQLIELW